jgi:hypothetical protein
MKYLPVIILLLSGCGYSARNIEAIGQVKRIADITPLFCPDRQEVDLSLGVMRNGSGSMSTQDLYLNVLSGEQLKLLKQAAESGKLVKIVYDALRLPVCTNPYLIKSVEILGNN